MTDRPILFSAPMVRAIIREIENPGAGKNQTRRILNPQPKTFDIEGFGECKVYAEHMEGEPLPRIAMGDGSCGVITLQKIPFAVGDRLWVRESWQLHSRATDFCTIAYMASVNHAGWSEAHEQLPNHLAGKMRAQPFQNGWRPSIHMPRWASRLTLTVTDVRIERLRDISEADARCEGCDRFPDIGNSRGGYRPAFEALWDSINGKREGASWADNPWVVAISFTAEQRNIDQ